MIKRYNTINRNSKVYLTQYNWRLIGQYKHKRIDIIQEDKS